MLTNPVGDPVCALLALMKLPQDHKFCSLAFSSFQQRESGIRVHNLIQVVTAVSASLNHLLSSLPLRRSTQNHTVTGMRSPNADFPRPTNLTWIVLNTECP